MVLFQYSLLKFATKDSTLADGIDASQAPDKDLIEKEKASLKKLLPLVEKFVHEKVALQVSCPALCIACYAVDRFAFLAMILFESNRGFREKPKGSYDPRIAFRFCCPAFATLRLRGRQGRDGCQSALWDCFGDAFSTWRKFMP